MRLIARLDIKNEFVIKGIQLEGLRKVGCPIDMSTNYFIQGIDEIIFLDAVASNFHRDGMFDIIKKASENIFVPIAIGGGIRNLDDVSRAIDSGADKIIINSAAIHNIKLISNSAEKYGSQCIIGSIEAKKINNSWEVYINNGRDPTGIDVFNWIKILQEQGVGEILITSIDKEGLGQGFDIELIENVQNISNRPIIVSGGYGEPSHLNNLLERTRPSGIAFASVLHYKKTDINNLRETTQRLL